jgi:nitrogen fixation/metabolism regulation signal transduction histidine kinase
VEPREQLAQALSNWLTPEQLSKLVDEVLSIEKRARAEFMCKKCGQRQIQFGSVSDAKAVSQALTDLLTQAYGRPGEEAHQAEPIMFIRVSTVEEAAKLVASKSTPTGRRRPPRKTVSRPKQNPEKAA